MPLQNQSHSLFDLSGQRAGLQAGFLPGRPRPVPSEEVGTLVPSASGAWQSPPCGCENSLVLAITLCSEPGGASGTPGEPPPDTSPPAHTASGCSGEPSALHTGTGQATSSPAPLVVPGGSCPGPSLPFLLRVPSWPRGTHWGPPLGAIRAQQPAKLVVISAQGLSYNLEHSAQTFKLPQMPLLFY